MTLTPVQAPAERALSFLNSELQRKGIEVETVFAPNLPEVLLDSEHIYQVVFNIIFNAIQAMPQGGRLHLETQPAPDGDDVSLSITDTGCGIGPEALSQIFTPFYTDKNRGTGLGLAIVRSIVEKHGGTIEVASLVGAGSCFTVTLPLPPFQQVEPSSQQ